MKTRQFIRRRLGALGRSAAGGAAVELAVVLPILTLIAIGVSDLGRIFFTGITIANAARAGAQYGAQSTLTSADTMAINLAATNEALDAGSITVSSRSFCRCFAGEVGDCTTGDCGVGYGPYRVYVEVTVTKTVAMLFQWPGLPASVPLSKTATFRVQ